MQTLVTADEMRWCDEKTIRTIGIPAIVLMENAGGNVARFILNSFGPLRGKNVIVFSGKGNNGGDGFVIARHLSQNGARVFAVLLAPPAELKGDAKSNFAILQRIARLSKEAVSILRFRKETLRLLPRPDIIVDAIFGTGFSSPAKGVFAEAIGWINAQAVPRIAVDVPSGVNGTTGIAEGPAVKATVTTTLGLPKTGLFCNDARDHTGKIVTLDIGIPAAVVESGSFKTFLVESSDISPLLPRRPSTAHKYSTGKVFVLAGSRGYTGAAALCAKAALRTGAGAVVLGTPDSVYPILARKLTEAIIEPLPSTLDGSLSFTSLEKIKKRLSWADVIVIGPGLSRHEETQRLIQTIVLESRFRVLVDADALFALAAAGVSKVRKSRAELILTPHVGEYARFVGKRTREIEQKRIEESRSGAESLGKILVLKGAPTITATPEGGLYLNSTGNPGMATVGAGDVLSGIIGSLWAQGMKAEEAARTGVYLHGLSGDLAAKSIGMRSLIAQDMIDFLPHAFHATEAGEAT
ncbi:MAG TPA: NAD(P)H-hydrate dehydratase [Bacteroidota bacterium]|nr:NAD(P)H-hydrate dehydratase [Bacteroidota bacterium]